MVSESSDPVPPFPGWERRLYRLPRPVTDGDIAAFLGNEELYVRETPEGRVNMIHKYGLVELHCIIGTTRMEVWFNPENMAYPSEYVDALLATRF
jgi:hypothetical protein